VVRIKPGNKVWLFDEEGNLYLAKVDKISSKGTYLLMLERKSKEPQRLTITLAQAILKSNKMEFLIQKSTELGITAFIPVESARTIVRLQEKKERKIERWQRIAREAAKQCLRPMVPKILPPQTLTQLIQERKEAKKLLLSEKEGKYLKEILFSSSNSGLKQEKPPQSLILLTGPEGGWTEEEETNILRHGFEGVSLGQYTLRAETASLSALAIISHFWNS